MRSHPGLKRVIVGRTFAGSTEPAAPSEDVAFPGVDETGETDETAQEPTPTTVAAVPQLFWTSDSRFVIAPWIRGILIIDSLAEARFYTGLASHTVVAAATIR